MILRRERTEIVLFLPEAHCERALSALGGLGLYHTTSEIGLTGSLLLMDIEVQSLCREQPIEQRLQLPRRVLLGVRSPVAPQHYVRLQP
jgi:hypothetical protein